MTTEKQVYYFGAGHSDGRAEMKDLLGGKGANLCEMVNMGIPVPPGFVIATTVCREYAKSGQLTDSMVKIVEEHVALMEKELGRKFGADKNPLLVSVRSGAAASMPGMMDTVLNLGLTDVSIVAIAEQNAPFAWDSYRRFISMYSDIVMGTGREDYEHEITELKHKLKVKNDCDIPAEHLKGLCDSYKVLYKKKTGQDFPQEPRTQLLSAIKAVFGSWNNPRAIAYRELYNIKGLIGTAVNVQAMVFGNMNTNSATGVAFSRSPSDGTNFFYGEYLINAQGEDVVAGIRTPQQLSKRESLHWAESHCIAEADRAANYPSMEESLPVLYKELCEIRLNLEKRYRDMQDMEFTVQDGKLWMLQCRNGKRTIRAAVKCAVDMVSEGMITQEEAVLRIDPLQVDHLLHPSVDPKQVPALLCKGLAASPGAAVGQIVFTAPDAEKAAASGMTVVMVRLETSPEDLRGMAAAVGILTARGGMTSHAAVVARGMGKTCVAGASELKIKGKSFTVGDKTFNEGDWITLDGSKGVVYPGKVPLIKAEIAGDFFTILQWCQKNKRLGVRANADTPKDVDVSLKFMCEGVGLCRTEHMFFEGDRINNMRAMILASDEQKEKEALSRIMPLQKGDFVEIFKELHGLTCTIRLLDPPLHEYCPQDPKIQAELAKQVGVSEEYVATRVKALEEHNPMLGLRGVRVGLIHPAIYNMQVEAILEAAVEVKKQGIEVHPEIMIPLVGKVTELEQSRANAEKVAAQVLARHTGVEIKYSIGTMVEVPRACLTADQVATQADFFSFGTNDLTQMGCGFSRDDAGLFLKNYLKLGIYAEDPFHSIDQEGIGQLIKIAIEKGRSVKPDMSIGVCGETGGDPESIYFYESLGGIDYVSCSPFRVPVAIVAAAHAHLKKQQKSQHSTH